MPFIGGKSIIDGYVQRRFADDVPSKDHFAQYMYQHWQDDGDGNVAGGERILSALLLPGAYARGVPLCERIPKLDPSIPVTMTYGSRDWMDISAAREVAEGAPAGQHIEVHQIAGAGHQLMIDQPEAFNDVVLRRIMSTASR